MKNTLFLNVLSIITVDKKHSEIFNLTENNLKMFLNTAMTIKNLYKFLFFMSEIFALAGGGDANC